MAKAIQERLTAFTRAHELTRPGLMGGDTSQSHRTTLKKLIEVIVAPYAAFETPGGHTCVVVTGEDITISGAAVTGLALVLHEFTTNAAKYGALSTPTGSVHLLLAQNADDFLLTWTERGGPAVDNQAKKKGFGSVLSQRTVKGQFGGDVTYVWDPAGLIIHMRLPLTRLT
jgi:two-component sensor histidine kinase